MPKRIREDLLPGARKAQKIRNLIRECIEMSDRTISQNFSTWDNIEGSYRAYRMADDQDKESLEKFGVQKIIFPIQFATVQIMLTFMMEVFTSIRPVLRVRGAEPSSKVKAQCMEVALDYDWRNNRGYFTMQQWFFNAFRYGYGIMRNTWEVRQQLRKIIIPGLEAEFDIPGLGKMSVPGSLKYDFDMDTVFEGNKWNIVDNRSWYPDPRYSLSRFQEGNFCGERDLIHDHDLWELEDQDIFFNTTELKSTSNYGSVRGSDSGNLAHNRDQYGTRSSIDTILTEAKKNKMHLNEMLVVKIIPKQYELSDEERPCDYIFNLIDDNVICRAEPSAFMPRFPYSVVEPYPDILAFMSQGVMELTQPLSQHLNFLFNSHMANVRKAVNDRFLADPSRIDLNDFLDPESSVIRLLQTAYGSDPAQALKQLQVVDITKGHFADAQQLIQFWEIVTGATQHMFGQVSAGRRTAFELQGVFRQAGARMKMCADMFSAEGVAPLTEQMALLRKENMSMEQFMQIAGQTAKDLGVDPSQIVEGFVKMNQGMLDGVFQYPAEESSIPADRADAADTLQQLFQTVSQAPFLTQAFDLVAIFREMIKQKGLKNMDDFLAEAVKAQTMIMTPDQLSELYAQNKIQPYGSSGMGGNAPAGSSGIGNILKGMQQQQGDGGQGGQPGQQPLTMSGAMNGAGSARQNA